MKIIIITHNGISPQSTRGISDGELYKFVGYRLANGHNPFDINYEVPPLAKYIYGLFERYLSNPYLINLVYYLGLAILIYSLSFQLTKDKTKSCFSLLLFIITPFLATQLKETMLDLPLTFFFTLYLFFFIKYLITLKINNLYFAGISLGLATGTKIGAYTPLLLFFNTLVLALNQKKFGQSVKLSISLILFTFVGYVMAYFCYFIVHPNPIPWLKLHQKPLEFYLQPKANGQFNLANHLEQFKNIFLKPLTSDWSPVVLIGTFLSFINLKNRGKDQNKTYLFLSLYVFTFVFINFLITPYYARYLMPTIPLFIILTTKYFSKKILIAVLIVSLPFYFHSLVPNNIQGHLQASQRFFQTRAYRELYRSLDNTSKNQIDEFAFADNIENFLESIKTRSITVNIDNINQATNHGQAEITIKYQTAYGQLTQKHIQYFVKQHNQWKTEWHWDYLWPNYQPNIDISIETKPIPLQGVKDINQQTIAKIDNWYEIYNITRLMYRWPLDVDKLSELTSIPNSHIDKTIKTNIPDDYSRFVAYLKPSLNSKTELMAQISTVPGLSIIQSHYLIPSQIYPDQIESKIIGVINDLYINRPEIFNVPADIYFYNHQNKKIYINQFQLIKPYYLDLPNFNLKQELDQQKTTINLGSQTKRSRIL